MYQEKNNDNLADSLEIDPNTNSNSDNRLEKVIEQVNYNNSLDNAKSGQKLRELNKNQNHNMPHFGTRSNATNLNNNSNNLLSSNNNVSSKNSKYKNGNALNQKSLSNRLAGFAAKKAGIPKGLVDAFENRKGSNPNSKAEFKSSNIFDNLLGATKAKNTFSLEGIFNLKITGLQKVYIGIAAGALLFLFIAGVCLLISSNVYLTAQKLSHSNSSSKIESKIDELDEDDIENTNDNGDIDEQYQTSNETTYLDYSSSNIVPVASKKDLTDSKIFDELEDFYPIMSSYGEEYNIKTVYKFFLKLNYIKKHYKEKYDGVEIDLPLLMATLILQSNDMDKVFVSNTKGYSTLLKENNATFDYDKNFDCYMRRKNDLSCIGKAKISQNESRYDIEVLVQHMVSKQTEEKCIDSSGKVTDSNILRDDEISNLECGVDEKYQIGTVTYKIDDEKYREFLKEFIEKKYYLNFNTENENESEDSPKAEEPSNPSETQISPSGTSSEYAKQIVDLALKEYAVADKNIGGFKYKNDFGSGYSCAHWCVIFSWWLSKEVGIYPNIMPFKEISTGTLMRDFVNSDLPHIKFYYNTSCKYYSAEMNNGVEYTPKPGDFAFFDWDGGPAWTPTNDVQEHTAVVLEVSSNGKKVTTVNGNFGGKSSRQDLCLFPETSKVKERTDSLSNCQIIGFGSWY